jgi:hypothetical protein
MELNRNYLGGIHGPGFFTAEMAAQVFMDDRPEEMTNNEFQRRLEMLVTDLPSIYDGRARLQQYVQERIVTLTERLELMEFREKRDRATAIGEAESDVTAAGDRRKRYAATSVRISHAALRMLITLKNERRKFEEGEPQGVDEEASPAAQAAPAPAQGPEVYSAMPESNRHESSAAPANGAEALDPGAVPAVANHGKNEPVTTQVPGNTGRNNAPAASPAAVSRFLARYDHDALVALVARSKQELARLREKETRGG